MIKLCAAYICLIALIGMLVVDELNKRKCLESIYKTDDYDVKNGVMYCRSSDNSYQRLIKPKTRSPHLDSHKKEKNNEF